MQQNEMQKQRTDIFEEFMDTTFELSKEELQAIHGIIPMTQELFERCVQKCEEIGAVRQLEELIAEFPELYRAYRERTRCTEDDFEAAKEGSESDGTAVQGASADEASSDIVWQRINSRLEKMSRS